MKFAVMILAMAFAYSSVSPSAVASEASGDIYTIAEILPDNPAAGDPISAVVIFSCSTLTPNPQGEG